MTSLVGTIKYNDTGHTWCFEHGRQDWCDNKAKKEGIQMSKVIEDAQERLDAEVAKVLAGDDAAKMLARGIVEAMGIFLNRDPDELAREAVARVQAANGA